MLICIKIISFKNTEIKITKTQSESSKEITHEPPNMLIFSSVIFSNDIEDHREHENQDCEEDHEDLKISYDAHNHSHNITETLNNSHEEECLKKTNQNNENDCNFGQ